MFVTILSFGFKHGIPTDSDLIFDVRFLPNPYYVAELKKKTGLDQDVFDYVMDSDISREFIEKLDDMIAKLNENDKITTDVRATMDSLKEASDNAKEITKEVKEIIVDKDIRKQVSTTLDDAHKLAKAVDETHLKSSPIRRSVAHVQTYVLF